MIYRGDCKEVMSIFMDDASVDCCVTSPPYWGLRDYGVDGQIGAEPTPDEFVDRLVDVFREVRRVLKPDGTLWLNLGDSYARNGGTQDGGNRELMHMAGRQKRMLKIPEGSGLKVKDLVGIPWRTAFALQKDGWYLRSDIIWNKPNCMPTSCKDRPTTAHEYIFLLSKSPKYFYDYKAILEPLAEASAKRYQFGFKDMRTGTTKNLRVAREILPRGEAVPVRSLDLPAGRNKRSVWTVTTKSFKGAHFATFPPDLIEPCILAGSRHGGVVLDPFFGAGTTGLVAKKHGRKYIGIELNPAYIDIAQTRLGAE